jgi:hypothetical protein
MAHQTIRAVPRLHRILHNMGYPASVAAMVISCARTERDPIALHTIQIAWHNRHSLQTPLPHTRRYR